MPFFSTKFTKRLASTIDLIQGVQSNSNDANGRPVQYVTGAFAPMYRERKKSAASQFIGSAMAKANASPSVEKSRELIRKFSKKHPPHEVRAMLKESIVVIRNPENDEIPPICEAEDFGSKGMTKYQLEAVDEFIDDEPYCRSRPIASLPPPVPVNNHPHEQQHHRTLRAVASEGSIRSHDSSSGNSSRDSPPISTPRDSFGQETQQLSEFRYGHSRTPSNDSSKSVHPVKSTPLLNRSLQRRVALNTPLVRPLDVAMMEVSQPDYQYRSPHYIKYSDSIRKRNSIESGLDVDPESQFGRPLSWGSETHSRDFHLRSPTATEFNFGERNQARDSYGTIESRDWHSELSPVNTARLNSAKPTIITAPRVASPFATSIVQTPSPPPPPEPTKSQIETRSIRSVKLNTRKSEGADLPKSTPPPLRPSRSYGSLRMRAKRLSPTPPSEIPPVPAIPAAFANFPKKTSDDPEMDVGLTGSVHRQRRLSWGNKDAPTPPLSKFIGSSSEAGASSITSAQASTSNSLERQKTLPLSIPPKTPKYRPRRLSRDLPSLPPAASQTVNNNHGIQGSLERMRAAGSTTSLVRANSASGPHGLGTSTGHGHGHEQGKYHYARTNDTTAHPALVHQQRQLSCGLCDTYISPSTPSVCSLKCCKCSSTLCAECFETLSIVDEDVENSESDYSGDDMEETRGARMRIKSRNRLSRKSKGLQMAQCADCMRCWCASCSKGNPWRYFRDVVTEVRDDSSEMTTALGNDDSGLFIRSKKVCPACYETNMVQGRPTGDSL